MILKRSSFMMLGSMVFSAALLLSACGDSSSTTNGDDDLGVTEVKAKSSSSSKKKNSSSSSDTSVKDAEDPSDLTESKSLPAPSGVTLTRLAPSVWELTFSYESDEAEKFVVQRFAPGNKSWEEYDEIDAEMTRFLVDGADNGGYYYRFAAKNDKSRSAYTKEVFVSDEAEYADGISLAAPTAKPNVSEENVLEIVLTGNYPSKKVTNSTYNKNSKGKTVGGVFYQARFVTGAEKSVDTVKVSADKSSISKEFSSVDEQCNAYAQIRVVWTDKNGVSDYGDWSDPMGSKAGTNSNLIDEDGRCDGKGSSDDEEPESSDKPGVAFAVPTNLMVQKQDAGTWMLEWSYVPVKTRAEKGFIIQKLDLEKSKWENFDSTGAGVYRAMITGLTDPYNYFRVAAYDKDGKSDFSSDVLIALTEEDAEAITVAPPANLAIARIAPSVWELSWQYDIASDNPDRKFIIQSSKLKDFEWTDLETDIEGNVRYYRIQGRDNIETYYRMAVIDNGDTSAFTQAIQLTPEIPYRDYMALNVPVPSMKLIKYYTTAYEVDMDTSTKTDVSFVDATASYTITENFISKYIAESEYTDTVYYEARWFTSLQHYNDFKEEGCEGKKHSDACDSCYWIESFPYAEPSITKGFYESDSIIVTLDVGTATERDTTLSINRYCARETGYVSSDHAKIWDPNTTDSQRAAIMAREAAMSMCLLVHVRGICSYYIQLRIVWTDKNKETDWSEWTQPFSVSDIGGADDICGK